jgi:hypothetical protein
MAAMSTSWTATRPPGRDDPLQSLIDGGFREAVVDSIKALPEREQLLMALYYEQEMNLKEIGAVMGVSESRACQLHSQAISRMRSYLREHSWSGGLTMLARRAHFRPSNDKAQMPAFSVRKLSRRAGNLTPRPDAGRRI